MNASDIRDFRSEARQAANALYDITNVIIGFNEIDPEELGLEDETVGEFYDILAEAQANFRYHIRSARTTAVRLDDIINGQDFEHEEPINFIRTRYPQRSNPSHVDFNDSYQTFTRFMLDESHQVARELFGDARDNEFLRDLLTRRQRERVVTIDTPVSNRTLATLLGTRLRNRLMESGVDMNIPREIIVHNPDRSIVAGVLSTDRSESTEIEEEEDWERALRMGEGGR